MPNAVSFVTRTCRVEEQGRGDACMVGPIRQVAVASSVVRAGLTRRRTQRHHQHQLVRWERGQNAPAAVVGESVVRTRETKGRVDGTSTPGCDASHRRVAGVSAFLLRSFSAKCEGISTTFPFSTHCSGLVSIECPVVRRTDASGCFHAC
jgi:hypothetical protein